MGGASCVRAEACFQAQQHLLRATQTAFDSDAVFAEASTAQRGSAFQQSSLIRLQYRQGGGNRAARQRCAALRYAALRRALGCNRDRHPVQDSVNSDRNSLPGKNSSGVETRAVFEP